MLQARGFDAQTDSSPVRPTTTEENRFPYGWRYVTKRLPTGEEVYDQIPLTANDLLNPQLEDQVPQRDEHLQPLVDLIGSLKTRYAKDPTMGVFSDLIMDWGIPGLAKPAPDIAIVPQLKRKHVGRSSFKVVQEGTRPCLVIEVMSPNYPGDDTDKMDIYSQAGIAEYFLIKPYLAQELPHYELRGYRLEAGKYRRLVEDSQGRLLSQTLQLWFAVADQGRQVRVTDVRTGLPLLTQIETEEARRQEQKARQQEQKARRQEQKARRQEQKARLAAEARADAEAKARAQTEAARLAAEARADAEAKARAQTEAARLAAEARADAEAKARAELEQRLRELESLLNSRS